MSTYAEQRAFSNQHMPQVRRILWGVKKYLTCEDAPEDLDRHQAIDLIINGNTYVGVRVRSNGCQQYKHQLTFRKSLTSDELHKIVNGQVHYWFVGYLNGEGIIDSWGLYDMNVFRLAYPHLDFEPVSAARSHFAAVDIAQVEQAGIFKVAGR